MNVNVKAVQERRVGFLHNMNPILEIRKQQSLPNGDQEGIAPAQEAA